MFRLLWVVRHKGADTDGRRVPFKSSAGIHIRFLIRTVAQY